MPAASGSGMVPLPAGVAMASDTSEHRSHRCIAWGRDRRHPLRGIQMSRRPRGARRLERRVKKIGVRLTPELFQAVQLRATEAGCSLSAWVRRAIALQIRR